MFDAKSVSAHRFFADYKSEVLNEAYLNYEKKRWDDTGLAIGKSAKGGKKRAVELNFFRD